MVAVFAVTVPIAAAEPAVAAPGAVPSPDTGAIPRGAVLIVEDDAGVRDSLGTLLQAEGYRTAGAADGAQALALVARREFVPDLAIVDYNLPGGLNGVEVAAGLRETLGMAFPVMVLTGEMSSRVVHDVTRHGHVLASKPIQVRELLRHLAEMRRP
jgi:two-component system CheB/CheR fusion protein